MYYWIVMKRITTGQPIAVCYGLQFYPTAGAALADSRRERVKHGWSNERGYYDRVSSVEEMEVPSLEELGHA
jgi:hypothetical protein